MAFTATIQSVNMQNDMFNVAVAFADSGTGWNCVKNYLFPTNTTAAQAQAQITADGNVYKAALVPLTAVLAKVGTVITI